MEQMEVLYRSKGISKAAATKKLVSVIISLALMVGLIIYAGSEVKGKTQAIPNNGKISYVRFNENRFSAEEQKGIVGIGFVFGIMAIIDAATLGLSRTSWTEIHKDTIKGSFMDKTVAYPTADITKVDGYGNYLILTGKFGRGVLIVENTKAARKVIDDILLSR